MKILLLLLLLLLVPDTNSQMKYESVKNGSIVTLKCGEMSKGPVIWSRDRAGRREDILTIEDGGRTIKHINDTLKFYHTSISRSLMITRVSSSDAGLYYCNSTAVVCLTVTSGPAMRNQDKCDTRLEDNTTELKTSGLWTALLVVGGVVLLLALASLSTRKGFSKRKEDCEMPYDDVYTTIEYATFNKA